MADIESSGYPADGISEKDEIVAATKPDVNSTTMDDPREDSQFEDAESDFNSPVHSATKSPMHSLRDEDSRDSGINHSESGSDRPEKQDLPESQYEDADIDSNADLEEDNEPLDCRNGQSVTEYNENMHDNDDYPDGDAAEGYMENDSPEENYVQEQKFVEDKDNMQIDSNFIEEVDLDGIDDVPESQPEDEINMQEIPVEGEGEEVRSKSEEDVVEKYEEEEVQERFKDDDYQEENEQFREEFEYYVTKEFNGEYDQYNKPEENYSEAVVDQSEEVENVIVPEEDNLEDVPYELPESQLNDGSGQPEETEAVLPVVVDVVDEDYISKNDFIKTVMPETGEFTNEILKQANNIYSQQQTELCPDKQISEHGSILIDEDSINASEPNPVPEESGKYEGAESDVGGHYDIPVNDMYDEQEGVHQHHYNFHVPCHPVALEQENESSLQQDLPKTEYTNLSKVSDMPVSMNTHGAISSVEIEQFVDNVGADMNATEKVADIPEQNAQKHSPIKANVRQTPKKVYTNFDDIPVGMASSYIYQPPKQSKSAEENQDSGKFERAQSKRKPQEDAVMKKGCGRGIGKQSSQVAVKGNVQAKTNISRNTAQRSISVDKRTMKPASNVEESQSRRQLSARSSELRQLNPTRKICHADSRETKFFVPLDVDENTSSLQEPKKKQDTPGTAVRVIKQSGSTRATSKTSPVNNSNSKSPVSSMTRGPVRKDEKGSLNKGIDPVSKSISNTPEKRYVNAGEDEWKDHSAERLAYHGRHAIGKEVRPVKNHRVQDQRPTSDKYMEINQQHLDPRINQHYISGKDPYGSSYSVGEIKKKNEEILKLSPGIARRQVPHDSMNQAPRHALPDNISQAQSRRYAEYGMTNYSQPHSKDYEYPESLDIEAESRHSSTTASPYHQAHTQLWQQNEKNDHHSIGGTPNNVTPTHHSVHHSRDSEEPESEHQPKCTCGQVVYDDIAESQAYLIERNKRKVAERAAEIQAKKDEVRLEGDSLHSKEQEDGDIFLRPTNRRRNSYELANRDHSPTPDHEGNRDIDRYGTHPGRQVKSKKDLEEPASLRRYKVFDVDDARTESRGLSAVDHATLAKLAQRELADMERSRAVRDYGQPTVMSSPQEQTISPARSSQASPRSQSPKKLSSKTTSPAKSSSETSPTKTLPTPLKTTPPSKSNESARSSEHIEGTYDKKELQLSGLHALELSKDFGYSRPEDDQFMDADEGSDEDGGTQHLQGSEVMTRWYSDVDKPSFYSDDGVPVSSLNEIQAAISESKTKLLKSPTFYVEQEPEEPVWILRPFYAKKQIQDEERKKQEIEKEKERRRSTAQHQQQRHSVSPGSLGSSDEDIQNRNPQGYLRKQESDDEDDDVEQKPLISSNDYDHGIPPDHVHSEECYLRNPRPRQATESIGPDLPPSGSKTKEGKITPVLCVIPSLID
ncbi:uncharacterized protein LOC102804157 [Saccoglossus kowalevskii]|uniref:Microtubule-associated protein futsch-like n=1 Tax=Saccoglossus kowalevskii TaxID=10224 RepID=A0ABM0M012_SACKO|nr:PREDICTED: microtubule-associated protein futsch-like [Saccoglossus kowalevskii]